MCVCNGTIDSHSGSNSHCQRIRKGMQCRPQPTQHICQGVWRQTRCGGFTRVCGWLLAVQPIAGRHQTALDMGMTGCLSLECLREDKNIMVLHNTIHQLRELVLVLMYNGCLL